MTDPISNLSWRIVSLGTPPRRWIRHGLGLLLVAFACRMSWSGPLLAHQERRFPGAGIGSVVDVQSGHALSHASGRHAWDLFGPRRHRPRIGLFFAEDLLRTRGNSVLVIEGGTSYQRTSPVSSQSESPNMALFVLDGFGQEALLGYGPVVADAPMNPSSSGQPDTDRELHLELGWTPGEVQGLLGIPQTRIRLANREVWQYPNFSLLFEDERLKEIR